MNTYLIDTNIIVYAYNLDSDPHKEAFNILQDALNNKMRAFIADKSLYEFYAIITDPKRVEKPVSAKEAIQAINFIKSSHIKIIMPTLNSMNILIELLEKYNIEKQRIFDIVLAAMAIDNHIETILTRNDKDFSMLAEINVINPFTSSLK